MLNDDRVDILVVDDLPEKLLVLETILAGLGQNVVTARSGREALRRLLERDYAVILLDVNMPDMDGFETAEMIRSRRQTASTPIIFITAFSDEMHTAQGYSLGAVDYILSPVVPEILRTKVGVFVDLYKKTQQVKRQAEERVALAQEQAAREAAEEATRRSAFLAEASSVLARSLDYDAIPRGLACQAVPFLADVCAVTLPGEHGQARRTELAWVDPSSGSCSQQALPEGADFFWAAEVDRVFRTGEALLLAEGGSGREPWPAEAGVPRVVPESVLIVPMETNGRVLGTIALGRGAQGGRYKAADVALAQDLAGRAAMAIDNARLYRDIQENDRRKNEFLAMLAHELRNPLAPIRNAVQVLRMIDLKDDDLQWANDVISRQVDQMVRLVDDLLDISRITGGKIQLRREPVDVAAVVHRAVETSRPLIDARRHELAVALPEQPVWVDADAVRLAQVLANLLNNAAKYTGEGGKIELSVTTVGPDTVFRVRDNGIGISPEMLSSVFDLFTQVDRSLDRSQGGLGIGLTLVRRLVEMHGGSVQAFSEGTNRGTEFLVRLPALVVPPARVPDAEPAAEESAGAAPCKVLVVDDHPDVTRSLARLLRLSGHEVRTAEDGAGALAEVERFRPEVVLLDIGLPGMDGYQVARAIRKLPHTESLVLVALTGYGQADDRRRSHEAGFDHHLVKPVDADALSAVLAAARKHDGEEGAGLPALTRT
jgi:signal transduction histidine kinase/DNA-binding response OmpR family regulator